MPAIVRAGATLNYLVVGSGDPVVLHHPLTADLRVFGALGLRDALIEAGFACVLVDSIGHGRSSAPATQARYRIHERVLDVVAVIDALSIDRFGFFGYSMGAWVGTGLLATVPGRVRAAVLGGWDPIAGAVTYTAHLAWETREAEFRHRLEVQRAGATTTSPVRVADLDAMLRCYRELFDGLPPLEALAQCRVPTLLFAGSEDPYREHSELAARAIGAESAVIVGNHTSALFSPDVNPLTIRHLDANARSGSLP